MPYTNAAHVLPPDLVAAIQEYVDGELLYIPKRSDLRQAWGSRSGSRMLLQQRNLQIRQAFRAGRSPQDLAVQYHLSEDSIRKIVFRNTRQAEQLP